MITRKKLIDALCQQELEWVLDGEHERLLSIMQHGFKGYKTFSKAALIQEAKDFELWGTMEHKEALCRSERNTK